MPSPSKPQLAIYAALAIAVVLIGARFLRSGASAADAGGGLGGSAAAFASTTGTTTTGAAASAAVAAAGATGGALVVDVKGAVRHPGVYRLPVGARTLDAVRRAGGLARGADRVGVNLAARVVDGGEVVVPERGKGAGGSVSAAGSGVTAGGGGAVGGGAAGGGAAAGTAGATQAPLSLDLNTASAEQLEQLDGVGPATAAKIVAWRTQHGGIASVDQLDDVPGIGPAKLAAIRAQLGR
jgi:competence protein ComEA